MDNKNISPEEKKDLRHADMDRFGKEGLGGAREPADTATKEKKVKNKQKKKGQSDREKHAGVPLLLDIGVALVIIAVIAALIVGAYFLFKYYSDSYKDASIQYTVLISGEDAETISDVNSLKNKEIYYDLDGNAYYFGKVTSVNILEGEDGERQITARISVTSKYKRGEGYAVDGNRIAVGCEYSLRIEENTFETVIIEMYKGGGKK